MSIFTSTRRWKKILVVTILTATTLGIWQQPELLASGAQLAKAVPQRVRNLFQPILRQAWAVAASRSKPFSFSNGNLAKTYKFTANNCSPLLPFQRCNWSDPGNWENNEQPPAILPDGDAIVIDPYGTTFPFDECQLDVNQTIGSGANLTIAAGKALNIYVDVNLQEVTLTNYGTINISSGGGSVGDAVLTGGHNPGLPGGILDNYGTLNNNGIIGPNPGSASGSTGFRLNNKTGGSLSNEGRIGPDTPTSPYSLILSNSGTLTNNAGRTLTIASNLGTPGSLTNNIGGAITNNGDIIINGSLLNSGTITNNQNLGGVTGSPFSFVNNAGGILNNGAQGNLNTDVCTLSASSTTNNYGSWQTLGSTENSGTVNNFGFFNVRSFFTNNGSVSNTGTLSGTGNWQGNLANPANGTVAPGSSPGILTIDGNYTNNGTLSIELGGTNAGTQYDQLSITGTAMLGGTLQVSFVNSFLPVSGNTFTILTCNTCTGNFSTVSWPVGYTGTVTYNANSVVLSNIIAPPSTLSINNVTISEGTDGTASALFTVVLTAPSTTPITVNYATADKTATTANNDYQATSGVLTFPVNSTTPQTISVPIGTDATVEADESFNVILSNAVGSTITKAIGIGTITNDDSARISITNVSETEGNSGTTATTFQINLSAPVDQPVSFDIVTADGTANVTGGDYVANPARTLSFPANTNSPLSYVVSVNGDTIDEADETFTVNLTATAAGFPYSDVIIADKKGLGIIQDDEPDAGSVLVFPYFTSSLDASNNTTVSITSSSNAAAILHVFVVDNNCTQADFYLSLAPNGCLSFSALAIAPGQTGYIIAVAIDSAGRPIQNNRFAGRAALKDGDYEGSYAAEVFRAISATPATIQTNGTATLDFDGTHYEQVPDKFSVDIQSPVDVVGQRLITAGMQGNLTTGVSGARQLGTGILTSSTGRIASFVNFLAGTCHFTSVVSLATPRVPTGAGNIVPSGQTGVLDFRINGGVGLMLTPKTAPGGAKIQPFPKLGLTTASLIVPLFVPTTDLLPTLSINDVSVVEGNGGGSNAVFTVTLNNAQFSCSPVTVDYATLASPGSDFTPMSGTLTFTPPLSGGTVTQTISVPISGEMTVEGDEQFVVRLSNPSGAVITKAEGSGTITNDDIALITVIDAHQIEGQAGTTSMSFQLMLSAPVDQPISLGYVTMDGSATIANSDYRATSGTLTFPANASGVQYLEIPVFGDLAPEISETFVLQFTPGTLPYPAVSMMRSMAVGTIVNDDINTCPTATGAAVPVAGDLTTTYSLVSGCGITMAAPMPPPPPSELPSGYTLNDTTVAYEVTTTAPYAGPIVLTFKVPFSVTEEQFARLRVLHGENGEFEDRTILAPDSPAPNFATREISARVTSLSPFIIAVAPLNSLSISDVNLNEGNAGTVNANFTVSLSNPSASAVTVQYQTADGTAKAGSDYTVLPLTTLTFNPGEQSKTISVPVNGDTTVEAIENFFVNLSNASGATLAKSQGVGTIANDDSTTVAINDVTVTEGNGGTVNTVFTVSLSHLSTVPVTVQYQTANGTATAGSDYTALPLTTLTFNPNEQSKTITVVVNGETAVEPNESFFVNLSNAVGATIADAQGIGRITNDDGDLPLLRVRAADPAVCLGPGGLIGITAEVTNPNAAAVTATWTATLPAPLLGLPGSGTATVNAPAMQVTTMQASWTGTLNAGQTVTFTYQAQIAAGTALDTQFCLQNKAQFNGGYEVIVPECFVANCPTLGLLPLANTRASDQKAGSLLVFPYYTSNRATRADTRLTISNVSMQTINTHVFFLDGATCSPADMFLCLTPGASFSFKASEYDPENTGFIYVVAVDRQGRPIQSNGLVGNAFVNEGEYYDTYGAVAFERYDNGITQPNGTIALLSLNGTIYDAAPVQFAVEIQSPLDVIGQRIIVAPIAGDLDGTATLPAAHPTLQTAATQLGIGLAINGQEKSTSFSALLSGGCLKTATLSATYPRVPGGLSGLIGKGATGHLQFRVGAGVGLLMTPRAGANQWSGIRGLHQTATSNVVLAIPVIAPAC